MTLTRVSNNRQILDQRQIDCLSNRSAIFIAIRDQSNYPTIRLQLLHLANDLSLDQSDQTVAYSETENFINSLNEALDALNKSLNQKAFTPIDSIEELRDGVLLATIIEKFEYVCGRKRRIRNKNYYQFIEDWLVSIGDMPYIPHYGKFVKHILRECDIDLIANLFGIVAITMYNNRQELWKTFNVEIFFLCLGEPLIPKINRILNQNLNIESDEKYAIIVQNRNLEKRIHFLTLKLEKTIEKTTEELKDKEIEFENKLTEMKKQLEDRDNEMSRLREEMIKMTKTIEVLTEENLAKNMKIEALRDLINGTDKTLVSVDELLALKEKVLSMQNQMKSISSEMEKKFNINDN